MGILTLAGIVGLTILLFSYKAFVIYTISALVSLAFGGILRKVRDSRAKQKQSYVFWLAVASILPLQLHLGFLPVASSRSFYSVLIYLLGLSAYIYILSRLFFFRRIKLSRGKLLITIPILGLSSLLLVSFTWALFQPYSYNTPETNPNLRTSFSTVYKANAELDEKLLRVQELYSIAAEESYSVVGIDMQWLQNHPDIMIDNVQLLESSDDPSETSGIVVQCSRIVEPKIINIGLLTQKISVPDWDSIRILLEDRRDLNNLKVYSLPAISGSGGYLETGSSIEISLPQNSYLNASSEGYFSELPDKDRIAFDISYYDLKIEVYSLRHLRIDLVQKAISSYSSFDIIGEVVKFLLWPIILAVIMFNQKSVSEKLISLFKKKPKKRQIGFHNSESKK